MNSALNISIVIYRQQPEDIAALIKSLAKSKYLNTIFLLDNSPVKNSKFELLPVEYRFCNKNLGYGAAHNIALRQSLKFETPFHLILNHDIDCDAETIDNLVSVMQQYDDIALMMPKIVNLEGQTQHLCKLLPSPVDLLCRRFTPRTWMTKRKANFEMQFADYRHALNVPYLSGCFMLLRTAALHETGLFDERFFLYPEDLDLSRRIHSRFNTVYYPRCRVTHVHAKDSYHNTKMLFIHIWNMAKYFNKWGWFFDSERKKINEKILKQPNYEF